MFILLLKLHIHLFRSKIKNNLSFRVQLLGKVLYLNDFNKLNYGRGYKFRHTMPVQIRFSDVDQFGHMNNSVYFSLYDLAKTTYIKDVFGSADWSKLAIVVANINANFFMPVFSRIIW